MSNETTLNAITLLTCTFDLRLNNGVSYHIECTREEMDDLIELVGDENITECEEL